jgi:hypothetical protein
MHPQAVALQQADDGQRQENDQCQGAGLDEAGANGCQDGLQRHASCQAGDHGSRGYHQHWIETQHEAHDDNQHPQ